MSRLRQINSQNYNTSDNIQTEFENIVRYVNAGEYGNKTLYELLALAYDTDTGEFAANAEFRFDTSNGLQFRMGIFTDPEESWTTIVTPENLRGNAGADIGAIAEPIFDTRSEYTATGGETELDLIHDASDLFMVYKNGLLLNETADYTTNPTGGTGSNGNITFNAALVLNDEVVIFKIATANNIQIVRSDFTTTGSQANFGFVHTAEDAVIVYLNGILQLEGGGQDYTLDTANDLVTFNTPVPISNDVTIIKSTPSDNVTVAGLMLETQYTNNNGFIPYNKLVVADGEITQAKVQDLVTTLAATPDIEIGATQPNPATRFWLDNSTTPNQLKFYDGLQYLSTNPTSQLPTFDNTDALLYLQVDATGTALQFASVDLSTVIPKTQKGAANGVPSLDTNARIPVSQLPTVIAYDNIYFFDDGTTLAAQEYIIDRVVGRQVTITQLVGRLNTGSATAEIAIEGVGTGDTIALTSSEQIITLTTPVTVDGTVASKRIGLIFSALTSPTNVDVTLTLQIASQ